MKKHNPIQTLMDEHEIISHAEGCIRQIDNQWKTDQVTFIQNVNTLLEFFKGYSDQFHHRKEEEILFKELRNNPNFLLPDILSELEEHHESFRATVKEIKESLNDENFVEVQLLLNQYINDLLNHIAVENDELFIMAKSLFSDEELERMFFLFQDIDTELGNDRKQQLEGSILK